jgi:hypothetical protein
MRAEDLRTLLQRQPYPLLRLHLSSGLVFELPEPDLVLITRSTVEILLPNQDSRTREAVISLLHVVWVEVLVAPE